jgi:hypothetical protein
MFKHMSKKTKNSSTTKTNKKRSSIRHTRAIGRNRSKRLVTVPPAQEIEDHLKELILSAAETQQPEYAKAKMRQRVLTLSVMATIVIAMIWRQVGSGPSEMARLLQLGSVLWLPALQVSQQAISLRLGSFAASLFLGMLNALLVVLYERWQSRQRPLPEEVAWVVARYSRVLIVDGSTLDVLIRKIGLLCGLVIAPLAGKMMGMLDLVSRLPVKIWFDASPTISDQKFWPFILSALPKNALLLFDKGFIDFSKFLELKLAEVFFITRAKTNLHYRVAFAFIRTATVHDLLIWVGKDDTRQQLRLIEVLYHGKWYRYLTNDLDPTHLPWKYVVAVYWQRWRIEDAYAIIKELLGLSYFWNGGQNGVELQLWATWMMYGVLLDLADTLAAALWRPLADISIEMVFRSLVYFAEARIQGDTSSWVAFLTSHARLFGLLKRRRKKPTLQLLTAAANS